jgi:hypothetical protein
VNEDEFESTVDKSNDDASRRRLKTLKALVRNSLYSKSDANLDDFKEELVDMTDKEAQTCLLIARLLKPYIPEKKCSRIIPFQLFFSILANDILRCTNYSKFCTKMCPLASSSTLLALGLDSASLYAILTRQDPNGICIFDYKAYIIDSEEAARMNKDAVFHSLFDMKMVTNLSSSYHVQFARFMTILPGLKTVRLLGVKKTPGNQGVEEADDKQVSHYSKMMSHSKIIEESRKEEADLKKQVKLFQVEISSSSDKLKNLLKADKVEDYAEKIKILHAEWKTIKQSPASSQEDIHNKLEGIRNTIREAKDSRYQAFTQIQEIRQNLKQLRQDLYYK